MAEHTVGFEWRPNPCVLQVLRDQWPKGGYSERPDAYQSAMRSVQIDLIACHYDEMDEETRKRAENTIAYLSGMDSALYAQERLARFRVRRERVPA